MPAFMFEKISPPVRSSPAPQAAEKPRGVIVQIFGRFLEARSKQAKEEKGEVAPRDEKK